MLLWTLVALAPIYMLLCNSFKTKKGIYTNPFGLPRQWTADNYNYVLKNSNFGIYFRNSTIAVVVSIFLILLLGSLAGYGLSQWRSRSSKAIYLFFIIGMMLPIKIASIRLLELTKVLGLTGKLAALFPIYTAMGLPIAVFILTEFIRSLPRDLYEAARIDGATNRQIFGRVVLPLIRPALATVAIYNLVPIWNDLWFPLILITEENQKTVLLAVTRLQGQYATDWPKVFALLTLSAIPVIVLYLLFSKNFVAGLTAGAVKG